MTRAVTYFEEPGMQFHQHGYVSEDPRIAAPQGYGIDRPEDLPDEMDVLIVGTGPAGVIAAAPAIRLVSRAKMIARVTRSGKGSPHPAAC